MHVILYHAPIDMHCFQAIGQCLYEWNFGCGHCLNVEVVFASHALCAHFGTCLLAPT
jgi:hypothetical protein